MPPSFMWTAVLQTTIFSTANLLVTHHTKGTIFADVLNNPGVSNWTDLLANASHHVDAIYNSTYATLSAPVTLPTTTLLDQANDNLPMTHAVNTTAAPDALSATTHDEESFYKTTLPIGIVAFLILNTLQYCWLIWLERILPARSRRRHVLATENVKLSEDHEEEIVNKWVAQGRVRRSSLNWCNTFLKWVLGLTIGRLWWFAILHLIQRSLKLHSPRIVWGDMFADIAMNYARSFLSVTALAELIALIILPAYKRMVFVAGMEMISHIFAMTAVRALATWAVQTEYVQAMIRNSTETMVKAFEQEAKLRTLKTEL